MWGSQKRVEGRGWEDGGQRLMPQLDLGSGASMGRRSRMSPETIYMNLYIKKLSTEDLMLLNCSAGEDS